MALLIEFEIIDINSNPEQGGEGVMLTIFMRDFRKSFGTQNIVDID